MANVDPPDDLTIPDDAVLWRRIPSWHWVQDENLGRMRPSTAAFEDDDDGSPMSVALASECAGPEVVLAGHEGFALAAFTAGFARQRGQRIARDPRPGEPWHAVVIGKKTHSVRKQLARDCQWVVAPPS
jgi:hypothetical protein